MDADIVLHDYPLYETEFQQTPVLLLPLYQINHA